MAGRLFCLMPSHAGKGRKDNLCKTVRVDDASVSGKLGRTIFASSFFIEPCVQNWPLIAQAAINAGGFENVSKQAMIIRLQDLGLLVNFTDHTSWAGQMRLQVAKNSTGKKFCPSSSIKSNIC